MSKSTVKKDTLGHNCLQVHRDTSLDLDLDLEVEVDLDTKKTKLLDLVISLLQYLLFD